MNMQNRMQLQRNASVLSADGRQVGSIDRVVLNPETKLVTHIVVRRRGLFSKEDKVVPVGLIDRSTGNEIALRDEAGDLQDSPPFEEKRVLSKDGGATDAPPPIPSGAPPVLYGSPVPGMSLPPDPGQKFVTQVEQNIPDGTVALKEGATIITAEGKHAGRVERVLADVPADRATHLLVSSGLFSKETKLIPITWVTRIGEDEVHLRVAKDALDELADTSIAADQT
jgi:sporulation protein YlmC with PRC-barrel domain